MKNFNEMFAFDHTVCVVDNGDYGLAFNRFTGKVLAQYETRPDEIAALCALVDVEEYRRAYGEYPPNETVNTALDFGYWFKWLDDPAHVDMRYDPPERDFRQEVLRDKLLTHFMPSVTDYVAHNGIRDIEIRPWVYEIEVIDSGAELRTGGIEEAAPGETPDGWGLYGRTFNGPAWHLCDVASQQQAYWLRAALAPLLIVTPRLSDPYEAAKARMEALDGVKFDPEGR